MDDKGKFGGYVVLAAVVVIGLMLLWHLYMDEIIRTLGWLLVFAIVFGAGVVLGRYSRRFRRSNDENKEL